MALPTNNQRKSPRRLRGHPASIRFVGKVRDHECRVLDLSRDGAKLLADIIAPIGSKLYLSSSPHAHDGKECEVTWRKNRMVGVRFATGSR